MDYYKLASGVKMPMLNLGTYQIPDEDMERVLSEAKELGYKGIDSAGAYNNEEAIGNALNRLGKDSFFITSKVDVRQFVDKTINGRKKTPLDCFDETSGLLGVDYIDLYLVHWPIEEHFLSMWRALERLYEEKRVGAIGVSNCQIKHLEYLFANANVKPMFNQFECHPLMSRRDLVEFCQNNGMQVEAHSPFAWGNKTLVENSDMAGIAAAHNKSITQIISRWDIQHGVALCPKSTHKERLAQNIDIFDFELSKEEMNYIDSLNSNSSVYDKKKKEVYTQLY